MNIQTGKNPVLFISGGASVRNEVLTNHFDYICRYLENFWDADKLRFGEPTNRRTFCKPIKDAKKQKKFPQPQEDRST